MERVVLLDEAGRATGTADKELVHGADTALHLAFSCYLFDVRGRLLLTRRAGHKRTWPGVWTNTCCGHPAPGESLADAVLRRLRDELGLAAPGAPELLLPAFRYRAVMADGTVENEMCPVYRVTCTSTVEPVPDPAEVAAAEWVPWAGFARAVRNGARTVSPWCARQVRELSALGADPLTWPAADRALLPPAAR